MLAGNHVTPTFINGFLKEATYILCYLVLESIEAIILSVLADNGLQVRFCNLHIHCDYIGYRKTHRAVLQGISNKQCFCSETLTLIKIIILSPLHKNNQEKESFGRHTR